MAEEPASLRRPKGSIPLPPRWRCQAPAAKRPTPSSTTSAITSHEQLKQIHLDIWEKWLGVLLRLATLCVGIAAAAAIGLMVWDARHSNGLLIEPFSVPPDLAQRGLTGQVVAARLLDRLNDLQTQTILPARAEILCP